jgi:hypothetical protein
VTTFEVPLDPDEVALVSATLVVVSYLRHDGTSGYFVQAVGDVPATTFLGLTVVAQHTIIGWSA